MNLLVTILSLTPAVGAMLRLLEERPKVKPQMQMALSRRKESRRPRRKSSRRCNHARLAVWRSRELRNPLRALRAP